MASLLLRLFHSDYFSPHLALSYLRTYSDNIGITYYLVSQLESAFPSQDVEFYWPQLCHLLITKPSESRALESFILRRCQESVHVALFTLWYFQASLSDLASNPHTASFQICQRVFNRCQRILFDDPLAHSKPSYAISSSSSFYRRLSTYAKNAAEKVSPSNPMSNIVGMGAVLASVPGMPKLASISGNIAIEQARKRPDGMGGAFTSRESAQDGQQDIPNQDEKQQPQSDDDDDDDDEDDNIDIDEHAEYDADNHHNPNHNVSQRDDHLNHIHRPICVNGNVKRQPSFRPNRVATETASNQRSHRSGEAPTSVNLTILHDDEIRSGGTIPTDERGKRLENPFASFAAGFNEFKDKAAAAVGDVFGQVTGQDGVTNRKGGHANNHLPPAWHPQKSRQLALVHKASNSKSVPNLVSTRGSLSAFASSATLSESPAQKEAMLALYDTEAKHNLLRSNYCKQQTQFLLSLQDISARLLLLPKPARLSALRAELTALNHTLPAEVCFPLWCTADVKHGHDDTKPTLENKDKRHHRVVRINPSEAVVLNSADRVPFLLNVEVLNNDLDFDPDRRQNREILKRLVTEHDVRRRKAEAASSSSSFKLSAANQVLPAREVGGVTDLPFSSSDAPPPLPSSSSPPPPPPPPDLDSTVARREKHVAPTSAPMTEFTPSSEPTEYTPTITLSPPVKPLMVAEDEEEIDLTEQAYGSDLAGFGEEKEPSSSDDEDLADYNRVHDTAAWTYAREHHGNIKDPALSPSHKRRASFSLDEYSERMRTAAIMLSQLNKSTNASAHTIVNYGPNVSSNAQGGWSSWIVPTNWYGSSTATTHGNRGGASAEVKTESADPTIGHASASVSKPESSFNIGLPVVGGGNAGSRLMYAETEAIRKRIMQEMMSLEEERMRRTKAGGRILNRSRKAAPEDEEAVLRAVNKDDPSAAILGESWASKKARIRASSPYGHLASWDVFSVIVKTGADLRQEQLAVQLINEFGRIWKETSSQCWVRYFRILVTSEDSGLMETITDAVSIHSIKKEAYSRLAGDDKASTYTLYDHFLNNFGEPSSAKFNRARDRFMESLAGYSIISYLLQFKDRHNGNILVDGEGRLIHIDFGFMLGISPGGVGFEAAPFKMPQDYIDILGGIDSTKFNEFKQLMRSGFRDVRKHAERIIMLVELMSKDSKLPCFTLGDLTAANLRDRFQLALSQTQCDEFVDKLILSSAGSAFTRLYDMYQRMTEGVL